VLNFLELYESFASEVYRFALWLAGDCSDAEDITSETFIRAWVHSSPIRTETLKAYLFAITRNIYLQQQRKEKRQISLNDVYPDPTPGPEQVVGSQLELQRVREALQSHQEIDRTAFILRVQHELPYAEIARILGLSLAATKVKVHRVRKKLLITCVDKEDV
jgi:RNA polymerase sigma-70 factor (ECF subfamily)